MPSERAAHWKLEVGRLEPLEVIHPTATVTRSDRTWKTIQISTTSILLVDHGFA